MKKIVTLASAVALAATSLSAGAWWGVPCMTQEQQQAMAQQQTKVREHMMATQRRLAEQMAARQTEMAKMAKLIRTQGVDPMTGGFSGTPDPLGTPLSSIDPWGAASPWGDMGMPEYPNMPAMPKPPSMPAMPEPFAMDMPQPPVLNFMRGRYAELEAYRSKIMKESKARRDKKAEEIAKRREEIEANRLTRLHRYGRPSRPPYMGMTTAPEIPASVSQTAPAIRAPAQVGGTAPASEATPTSVTATAQAPVTPVPAPEAAPVAPAPAATTP